MSQESSIQATFRKVVEAGIYPFNEHSGFMCHALARAFVQGIITRNEYDEADLAIQNYLRMLNFGGLPKSYTLRYALQALSLPSGIKAMTELYLNWDTRPYHTLQHPTQFIGN